MVIVQFETATRIGAIPDEGGYIVVIIGNFVALGAGFEVGDWTTFEIRFRVAEKSPSGHGSG